jgi:PIN domain nuclease of toxin-antitoxin system
LIVLDTHVLIWMDQDDPKLGRQTRGLIEQVWIEGKVAVSAITFWESALLHTRGRIQLPGTPQEWRHDLLTAGVAEFPLDGSACILAAQFEGLRKDPADRFIAATALRHAATLVTADERLLMWSHTLPRQDARL